MYKNISDSKSVYLKTSIFKVRTGPDIIAKASLRLITLGLGFHFVRPRFANLEQQYHEFSERASESHNIHSCHSRCQYRKHSQSLSNIIFYFIFIFNSAPQLFVLELTFRGAVSIILETRLGSMLNDRAEL